MTAREDENVPYRLTHCRQFLFIFMWESCMAGGGNIAVVSGHGAIAIAFSEIKFISRRRTVWAACTCEITIFRETPGSRSLTLQSRNKYNKSRAFTWVRYSFFIRTTQGH